MLITDATNQLILTLIGLIPPTVFAFFAWLKSKENSGDIKEIHVSLNSRLTELLEANKEAAHAAGRQEERDTGKPPGAMICQK
jgi:hypothetical protein